MGKSDPDTIQGGFVDVDQDGRFQMKHVEGTNGISKPAKDLVAHPRPWTKLKRNRKPRLAHFGISQEILDAGDKRYAQAVQNARAYVKTRSNELLIIHGYVSAGANTLLASAALALAASRFLYERAAEKGDVDLIKRASSLAVDARQNELAAWEVSAREALAKRRNDAANIGVPWLIGKDDDRKVGGRPRKEVIAANIEESTKLPAETVSLDALLAGEPAQK